MEISGNLIEPTGPQARYLELPVIYDFVGTLFPTSMGASLVLTPAIGVYSPTPVVMPGLVAPVMCNQV
jgi:hypothetical protein